jgi:hypothetical protein
MATAAACLMLAPAAGAGVTDQTATYSFNYFADSDDVHVYSSYTDYLLELERGPKLDLQWTHQVVMVPGIKAPAGSQEAVDAITTASRPIRSGADAYSDFTKTRNELQGDMTWRRLKGGYYVSSEADYFAQQLRAEVDHDFFGQNLNLSAGTSYGWDKIDPAEDADTHTVPDQKDNWHWSLVASQVLTASTVMQAGAELNLVDGLQHNPYRNVYVAGSDLPEVHPTHRRRNDYYVKLNQYLKNQSSLKLAYTYYTDDWGVSSHTVGARLSQYITHDLVVRYRYRYYTQGAAAFYRTEYTDPGGVDGLRTGDYRLGAFNAHLFGGRLDWDLGGMGGRLDFLRGVRLSLNYERYFNTNNFSANIFESGLSLAF